jgi:signal transduction histidine kinase
LQRKNTRLISFHRHVVGGLIGWTVIVFVLLAWALYLHLCVHPRKLAEAEARVYYKRDLTFRLWATSHGGVYVPIDEKTPPNSDLAHIPERDIVTPSGRRLTLMNPAYIMRQVYEEYAEVYGMRGRLTSLKPLRPKNAPDPWEKNALLGLAQGGKEAKEFVEMDGVLYLRMMQPLSTKKGCLKCHGHQGYKEGDLRGGVSITLPLATFVEREKGQTVPVFLSYGALWLLGLVGIWLGTRRLQSRMQERNLAEQQLQEYRDNLEHLVAARTTELESVNAKLRNEVQERKTAQASLDEALAQAQHLAQELREKNADLQRGHQELAEAHDALKKAQSQMLQREKMASIGQLAAGVAHEINNPVGFITSNLTSMKKYMERLAAYIASQAQEVPTAACERLTEIRNRLKIDHILADGVALIDESIEGTERIKKIVQDLKTFSRQDEATIKPTDINTCIESTLNIVWNELKYKCTVQKEYGELPPINCNPHQLNQVFMNLLVNAAQAIETKGEIGIKTWADQDFISIRISDTGSGIPQDKIKRIFEPFYTSKEVGKGTGLGLSIVYDIVVKNHHGDIQVESEVGKGTTFTVKIPVIDTPPAGL